MPELPTGTVTFLFTDLEGSTCPCRLPLSAAAWRQRRGRSSDFRIAAAPPAFPGQWRRGRPLPGHRGGPVPDSHRLPRILPEQSRGTSRRCQGDPRVGPRQHATRPISNLDIGHHTDCGLATTGSEWRVRMWPYSESAMSAAVVPRR
jgi:hypothetical protein